MPGKAEGEKYAESTAEGGEGDEVYQQHLAILQQANWSGLIRLLHADHLLLQHSRYVS